MLRSALRHCAAALPVLLALLAAAPAAAPAAYEWSTEPGDASLVNAAVAPDGTALIFGWPASNRLQVATRSPGGPIGEPQAFPVYARYYGPTVAFDAAGNALAGSRESSNLAYRPAGPSGTFGAAQSLTGFGGALQIAMAPTGEALVGTDEGSSTGGAVKVAFRPAGADAELDIANAQIFEPAPGTYLHLIGLQFDPDGAAVVVMKYGTDVYQAIREPGEASFGDPVLMADAPGLRGDEYQLVFDSDPAGHAVLAYSSGREQDGPYAQTRAVAAYRAPGGAFGTPEIVGAAADGEHISTVRAAINAKGDGLVAWTQSVPAHHCSPGDSGDFGVWAASITGGDFGTSGAVGPASFPESSSFEGVTAAGDWVALAYDLRHRGSTEDKCDLKDNSSDIAVRLYRTLEEPGLQLVTTRILETSTPSGLPPGMAQWRQPQFAVPGLHLGAAGTLLAGTQTYPGGVRTLRIHVHEDAGAAPAPTPTPEPSATPQPTEPAGAPAAGGSPSTPGPVAKPPVKIVALVPKKLVTPAPITTRKRTVTVLCPPEVGDECSTHLAVYAAFGVIPNAASAAKKKKKKRKAVLLASARTRVKPGATRKVKLKLSRAGRRAAKTRKRKTARMVITVTADGQKRRSVVKVKIGGR